MKKTILLATALDGDVSSYFYDPSADGQGVGFARMIYAKIHGNKDANFSDAVYLYMIAIAPP